ncbi:MAG: hypothetical protein RCG15_08820 [Candidatus Rickettsia vulgarisii]
MGSQGEHLFIAEGANVLINEVKLPEYKAAKEILEVTESYLKDKDKLGGAVTKNSK